MTSTTFSPTATTVFAFQATLDGALYNVSVPWNVSRQGWYFQVRDQSDNLIVNSALIGSPDPPAPGVNLVGGYFVTAMYFYAVSQTFVVP